MASRRSKLAVSLDILADALKAYKKTKDGDFLVFLSVSKAFEVAVEYSWREFKKIVEDEGLDAPSPKGAVRGMARIGRIGNPEKWIEYINARNAGVHDYFGTTQDGYVGIAREFLGDARKVFKMR